MLLKIIPFLAQMLAILFLCRFYLRFCMVGGKVTIAQLIAKLTNPFTRLLGSFLPNIHRWDLPALVVAIVLILLQILFVDYSYSLDYSWLYIVRVTAIKLLKILLDIIFFAVLVRVIMSWVQPGTSSDIALQLMYPTSDWILIPARRIIPPIGMLDLSPIAVLLGLRFIESFIIKLLL